MGKRTDNQKHRDTQPREKEIKLAVPETFISAFTGEMDFGVVRREETGELRLFRADYAVAGGIVRIEWPAAFTYAVIEQMQAVLADWQEHDEEWAKAALARARAAVAGLEVPSATIVQGP